MVKSTEETRQASRIMPFVVAFCLGWVLLPILVVVDDGARAVGSDNVLWQVLAAGVVGGVAGLIVGGGRLGWSGLLGLIIGALSAGLLPYLIVAPVFAIQAPGIDLPGQYSLVAIAASAGGAICVAYASRSCFAFSIRPLAAAAVGLMMLAIWILSWLVWVLESPPRSV